MITFKPEDIEGMYLSLLSARSKDEQLKELLSSLQDDKTKTKIGTRSLNFNRYNMGSINLPDPLRYVNFSISSNGKFYKGSATLNPQTFEETDKIFQKIAENLSSERDIIKMDKAILIMSGRDPYFSIEPDHISIPIQFGQAGTIRRQLISLEQFETDINQFADLTTRVTNACYGGNIPDIDYRFYIEGAPT
ncbi:MAG: hypothetical protein AABX29_02750 [Nanoarchaeota archaeon]